LLAVEAAVAAAAVDVAAVVEQPASAIAAVNAATARPFLINDCFHISSSFSCIFDTQAIYRRFVNNMRTVFEEFRKLFV